MTKDQVNAMISNPNIMKNLEYITTGSGTTINTSRIRGFVREKKILPSIQQYKNVIRIPDFYYTFEDIAEEEPPVSVGTLEFDMTNEWMSYIEESTGRRFYVTFDDMKNFAIMETSEFRYGAGGQLF